MMNPDTPLRCVILAAGASTRLRPLTDSMPKCLLRIGGKTLLERTIENVVDAGVKEIAVVIGYRGEMIREFFTQRFPNLRIRIVVNPNYASTNNAYSLLLARRFLENKDGLVISGLLLLDSDILFSPTLLPFLLNQAYKVGIQDKQHKGIIAIRVSGDHNDEEIRVKVDKENNIQLIGKEIPLSETYGESIGIETFFAETAGILFKVLERRVRAGYGRSEFYEASFQELIESGVSFKAIDVSKYPAIEIDTPNDLALAEQMKIN